MARSEWKPIQPCNGSGAGDEILRLAQEHLYCAVLSDTLDEFGLMHQLMESHVRPLDESLVLCGWARTAEYRDVYYADDEPDVYDLVLALGEGLLPGDVPVLACGHSRRIHPWGATQAAAAARNGAAGCVTDGLMRDVRQIRDLRFPAFCAGYGAIKLRGRGRPVALDVPVHCGGVWVSPGDLIFGDVDGVVVVPGHMVPQVVPAALERAERERQMVDELRGGASIVDVFRKYEML